MALDREGQEESENSSVAMVGRKRDRE